MRTDSCFVLVDNSQSINKIVEINDLCINLLVETKFPSVELGTWLMFQCYSDVLEWNFG